MKLRSLGTHGWIVWCPGCHDTHRFDSKWTYNGNADAPTFSPSLLVDYGMGQDDPLTCHSFLTDGVWNFLDDCTKHSLRGNVPMVELPDYWSTPDADA